MLPITLDGHRVPVALIGRGDTFASRARWLKAAGAERLCLYTDTPTPELELQHGPMLTARLPTLVELAAARLVWITGIPTPEAEPIAERARRTGALVNIEDVLAACDFHTPAVVRRGDLLLTVSTGGKSPGLAARIRGWLEAKFGPEWDGRLDKVAAKRTAWRRRERSLPELQTLTDAVIDHGSWLNEEKRP